ncbi:hypothetical protein ACFO25_14940 [Paenactinomyces guangxiensis]|uniref:Uncharacterized protein n=1 Tax=Paenactinomyces guangxiensis TaxID=1490290 RepID=A0A7W1WQ30_9BACL|nr:hypothetical protein [Paenactinomyces guangxiensis]MBA4493844.1 hypothetical protein [Paenactinomyces guangxiensis]MBH8591310.1 hypothetical protein [Paenactinomyces guangxiensis]
MTYIILIFLTYFLMVLNGRLLGIPGFLYYSSVRPVLRLYFHEKLARVEEIYYWEMADTIGRMAQLSIIPAYLVAIDLLRLKALWVELAVFFVLNYLWWVIYAAWKVKHFIPQTPALRPRTSRLHRSSL